MQMAGIVFTGCYLEGNILVTDYLATLDQKLPWHYEYSRPGSCSLDLTLERDENHSIIATSKYGFFHEKGDFALNTVTCPHIALEELLVTFDTEYQIQEFDCSHCGAQISTRMQSMPPSLGAAFGRPWCYWVTVIGNLGRSTSSGKDLWWRYALYSMQKDQMLSE
ncbi:hypothetical protein PENSUB_956 [Penicillium subrubescens]|uniref:Uncharacterized protein n=1 Tax=Penicillium subrubescens TaxID=1316194 RepID=A0A1Q5ULL4_9EURO|nr:hypothetical protein PENSUB_956 [Penicillium subrubescens]